MRGLAVVLLLAPATVDAQGIPERMPELQLRVFTERMDVDLDRAEGPRAKNPLGPEFEVSFLDQTGRIFIGSGMNALDVGFDLKRQRGRISLGAGDPNALSLRLSSDIVSDLGRPRLSTRIDLALAGHELSFALPDLMLNSRYEFGRVGVEVTVPVLEGRF